MHTFAGAAVVDFLQRLFFESMVLLLIVEAVILTVVLAIHRRTGSDASRRVLWGTLLVCVALLVLQQVVATSREKIIASVEKMVWAVDEGDMTALAEEIDQEFADHFFTLLRDRETFLADVSQQLQRYRVDNASASGFSVEVDGDRATVGFRVTCIARRGDRGEDNVLTTWKLGYVRRDDGWKLQRIITAQFITTGGMLDMNSIMGR